MGYNPYLWLYPCDVATMVPRYTYKSQVFHRDETSQNFIDYYCHKLSFGILTDRGEDSRVRKRSSAKRVVKVKIKGCACLGTLHKT